MLQDERNDPVDLATDALLAVGDGTGDRDMGQASFAGRARER